MNNGIDDRDNRDHGFTSSSGPVHPPYETYGNPDARENGRQDPPVEEPPLKEPPLEEPPQENPPVEEPPGEEPPLESPPGEDTPRKMPPDDRTYEEDPPLEAPSREGNEPVKTRFKSIAPRGGKEFEYDSRNYTYNTPRDFDRDQLRNAGTGAGESESQSPQRSEVTGSSRFSGYEIRTGEERGIYDKEEYHVRGGDKPPHYDRFEYDGQEKKQRSLLGTLGIVLLGAILGSLITLAALSLLLPELFSAEGRGGTGQPGVDSAAAYSTRPFMTAPAADIGDTPENRVAAKAIPSVVGITMRTNSPDINSPFGGSQDVVQGMGSGVIVSEDGFIVTNSHVVDNGEAWSLKIILADETVVDGEVLWSDRALDLAIVKADASGLIPVEIGSSEAVRVGDKAIAIGNPLGMNLQSTMTSGYISGLDRSISITDGSHMDGLLQTDAAINEGNSGGALLNIAGQLVGINTAKASGTASGIGFAIPIDTASPIIRKVMEEGSFQSVYLGLTGTNVSVIKAVNYSITFPGEDGVYIESVMEGTAAHKSGLEPNDIITAIDGQSVSGMTEMKKVLLNYELGDTVEITYYRYNSRRSTELTFAQDSSTIDQYIKDPGDEP